MGEEQAGETRTMVAALLASTRDPAKLVQGLNQLAKRQHFDECADLWATALYERDPGFFEYWLIKHIKSDRRAVIADLLVRAERDHHESFFQGLYGRLDRTEEAWNDEIRDLMARINEVSVLAAAIERRSLPDESLALTEDLAAAIYTRDPARFRPFVFAHCLPGFDTQLSRNRTYEALRSAAATAGDTAFVWTLFRRFASPEDWQASLTELVQKPVPAEVILGALRQRHPEYEALFDSAPIVPVLATYGAAILPYIDEHLAWLGGTTASELLPLLAHLGDDELYRRCYFRYGDAEQWNANIAQLIAVHADPADLAVALRRWTPSSPRWTVRYWWLTEANARALYDRDPARFLTFIERTTNSPDIALFAAAEARGDDAMLNLQTRRFFDAFTSEIGYRKAAPTSMAARPISKRARHLLEQFGPRIIAWLDRLAKVELPADQVTSDRPAIMPHANMPHANMQPAYMQPAYIHHAMGIVRAGLGAAEYLRSEIAGNPAINPALYLRSEHHALWLQSTQAIRDVLESNIVGNRDFGLRLLEEGGRLAHQRTIEHQFLLRRMVMTAPQQKTRRRALLCLERAATARAADAKVLLPVLESAMDYRADRSIDRRAMVSFVRARRAAQPEREVVTAMPPKQSTLP